MTSGAIKKNKKDYATKNDWLMMKVSYINS